MEYKVYIKPNSDSFITAVDSSAFLSDTTDWVQIDEGSGDRYHHAQGNYFEKPIVTDGGAYQYKLVGKAAVECTAEEIAKQEAANSQEAETPTEETSVWDELDAAYQAGYEEGYTEGVNSTYDQ